jgi:N-acetylglutamate synthase-like GNAT family acetyltransferase
MIRPCTPTDFDEIAIIINDGAQAYRGVIPDHGWHEPYMTSDELRVQIRQGVEFFGYEDTGSLTGVMGLQHVDDVTLIRHAYVRTTCQGQGIGSRLLTHLREHAKGPILIGAWASASWAIRFYEKQGFRIVSPADKDKLLRKYWSVPEAQMENSVVLAAAVP